MNTNFNPFRSTFSRHAAVRMQQRSISAEAVEFLLDYGRPTPVGGGATSYRFTASTWEEVVSALGQRAANFSRYRNAYVVESRDGVVITAAWLH